MLVQRIEPGEPARWGSYSMDCSGNSETNDKSISVLVADSTPLTAHLIADALRRDRGLTVSDASGSSVLAEARALRPDITILSENLEGTQGRGLAVLKQLRASVSSTLARSCCWIAATATRWWRLFAAEPEAFSSRNDSLKMLGKCGSPGIRGPTLG